MGLGKKKKSATRFMFSGQRVFPRVEAPALHGRGRTDSEASLLFPTEAETCLTQTTLLLLFSLWNLTLRIFLKPAYERIGDKGLRCTSIWFSECRNQSSVLEIK